MKYGDPYQPQKRKISSSGAIAGFFLGFMADFLYLIESSPTDHISIVGLAITILIFVGIGAVFGDKVIENLAEWLSWF